MGFDSNLIPPFIVKKIFFRNALHGKDVFSAHFLNVWSLILTYSDIEALFFSL